MPTQNARPLLVPQRKLRGKLSVLIDTRFDLQRSVNQTRFGEVIDQQLAIVVAIATAPHPADHVVSVRRSKRQNDRKLVGPILAWQLHEHKVRSDRLRLLLALTGQPN